MLNIREPVWLNKEKRSREAPKRPGFWRRLERSIRKRRKRWIGRIGFDREWYLKEYPDVARAGIDPIDHYIRHGIQEGRWKSKRHKEKGLASVALRKKRPGFFRRLEISIRKRRKRWTSYWTLDPAWYLEAYPEVRAAGIEPLHHYVSFGKKEGRQKRAPETDLVIVTLQSLKRACGFQADFKTNCSLNEIEGPWWILESKIQRPDGYWGTFGLRIRIGGREVHLERQGTVAEEIVCFRHLLKLPLGDCTIRLDWIEEGMPTQKILQKTCHIRGVSRVDQEKILTHPVDGQTDMTVMPKYGFWRHLEKGVRNQRKAKLEEIKNNFNTASSARKNLLTTGFGANGRGAGHSLFVDISPIVEAVHVDGVARVTRTVFSLLASKQEQDFDVVPVYSRESSRGFLRAHSVSGEKHLWQKAAEGEPAIQPQAGDIFLGLGLNPEGVCTHANLLAQWADEGVSIIFYVYDLLPIQYPQFWPLEAQTDILHHEWLSIVTSFDEVICISETTARRCREFTEGKYPPRFCYKSRFKRSPVRLRSKKVKISAIALGHDFDAELLSRGLPKNANELLKAFRAKQTFLMVGTLEPRKGHRQILEAFEQLWSQGENTQLVIVGRNGWLMNDFVARLEKHTERDLKLFWLSEVSDEFLAKIYEACTCLLAASIDEGFGLPLVEAVNRGKSILARDTEVFREVAGDAATFFKEDKKHIAEMILKFKTSDKKRNKPQNQKHRKWVEHVCVLINSTHETKKIFNKDKIAKICVVKLDHIGDLLLATPVFRALKKAYPKSKLTAVVNPGSAPILDGNPYVDSILSYSAPWFYRDSKSESMPSEILLRNNEVYKNLTKHHYDLVINLRGDRNDTNFAGSIPHKNLLSFISDHSQHSEVNLPVKRKENLHAWEQHKLLLLVGLMVQTDHEPEIFSSATDIEKSQEIISTKRPTIAIAPGAGIKLKEWGAEKYRQLILNLESYDLDFIVIGSKADVDLGEVISRQGKARNLCGQLSITELHEVLKQCVILVTNDSAPAHIGATAKTTVICITRPNVVKEFRPLGSNHIIISKMGCDAPCTGFVHENRKLLRSQCNCIASIRVDEVLDRVLEVLRTTKKLNFKKIPENYASPNATVGEKDKKNLKTLIVRGDLRSYSGYSYATRCYIKKWRQNYDEIIGNDISYHPARHEDVWQYPLIDEKDIVETCKNKDNVTVITISSPNNFQRFTGANNIGLFFYETDRFGILAWRDKILLMDEIRVPAPFLGNLVRSIKDSPLVVVDPVPLDECLKAINPNKINTNLSKLQTFAGNTDKTNSSSLSNLRSQYSHIFFSSCTMIPRKGLPVLAHEWLDFVKENKTCALLLKVSSIDISHTRIDIMKSLFKIFKLVSSQYSYREWNVYITTNSLSDAEISEIQGHADAFVTCSFGEGFGLGLFESLIMNKAVVCPAHSTFLDFLPFDYPYFLQTEIENYGIGDPACVYPISARWGVPTTGSLKRVLSKFIFDQDKGESKQHIDTARNYFLTKTKTSII
jgi:ADP-heptose:LPS heptosyltransferase